MIDVRGLGYTYAGADEPALRGLEFAIEEGEVFGFLGPSGAGKSTVQKVLIGLLEDYTGHVRLFDREVSAWGRELYERVGVAAETPDLYEKLTGRENLELFASLYGGPRRDPADLLERVGLAEAVDRRVGAYSKGMRVRLSFVRALLHDPELVFLDEPTAGIDPGTARSVTEVVADLQREGRTIVLTTHDMSVADRLCDRVAFIVDGRLPVVETPRTLKLEYGEPVVRVEYRVDGRLETRSVPLSELGEETTVGELFGRGDVETIHTGEATLEDVFVAVTGETLT